MIYEGEPGEESLDGIQTADGFIKWNGSAQNSQMQYFLRDHLGSVRVIAVDRNTVISRSDYLPFGVRMTGSGLNDGNGRSSYFGFSGKENEMWNGLDAMSGNTSHWLKGERYQHFGARAYDPVTCIFMQIDPMAEKYYGMSPYHYCAGNPVMLVDPDGECLNLVVGGLIGAAADYATQVTLNVVKGKSIGKALTEVDGKSILGSAVMGAVGAGVASSVSKMVKAGKVVAAVAEAGVQATVSGASSAIDQAVSTGEVNVKNVAADMGVSALSSVVGSAAKQLSRTGDGIKNAERQLDHAKRVAGSNPRPSRAAKVDEAAKKLESIGDGPKNVTEGVVNILAATHVAIETNKKKDD